MGSRLVVARRIDEVGNHFDVIADAQLLLGRLAQCIGDRCHGVALDDSKAGRLQIVGVVAHQGDVRAVQRGDHLEWLWRQNLSRQHSRDRVGHRIVDVNQIEALMPSHFDDLCGERQGVGWKLEQRVVRDHDLVVEEIGVDERQAGRQRIADDVNLITVRRQSHRQFGGHDAGAAESRIAANADPQRRPPGSRAQGSATARGSRLQKGSP